MLRRSSRSTGMTDFRPSRDSERIAVMPPVAGVGTGSACAVSDFIVSTSQNGGRRRDSSTLVAMHLTSRRMPATPSTTAWWIFT